MHLESEMILANRDVCLENEPSHEGYLKTSLCIPTVLPGILFLGQTLSLSKAASSRWLIGVRSESEVGADLTRTYHHVPGHHKMLDISRATIPGLGCHNALRVNQNYNVFIINIYIKCY